ncbi:MAG: iron transporter [Vicinamibacterales bacterium]
MRTSDEAEPRGLALARAEGQAFRATVDHMIADIADGGAITRAGEYLVGYAVEKAEGMYELRGGELQWTDPGAGNAHIEVVVCDGADGRFVPCLDVTVTVAADAGRVLGTHAQPLLWHPYLYHYGRNWTLPGDGAYTLTVHIEPPAFPRHDKVNGRRYAKAVDVTFEGVRIETGQD